MSEKQHCDKAKMKEGEKIADGTINVCLRGPRKNLIIPERIFLPLLRVCESQGEEGQTGSEGRAVNAIFAFPTRSSSRRCRRQQGAEKKGCSCVRVTCVVRRDFARDNKIYLFSAWVRGDATRIIANSRPRTVG